MRINDAQRRAVGHERPALVRAHGVENRIAPRDVQRLIPSEDGDRNQGAGAPARLEPRTVAAVMTPADAEPQNLEKWNRNAIGNAADARRRTESRLSMRGPALERAQNVARWSAAVREARQLRFDKRGRQEPAADAGNHGRNATPNSSVRSSARRHLHRASAVSRMRDFATASSTRAACAVAARSARRSKSPGCRSADERRAWLSWSASTIASSRLVASVSHGPTASDAAART